MREFGKRTFRGREGTEVAKALRGAYTAVQGEEGHRGGGGRDC